jgi:hypothetical protein
MGVLAKLTEQRNMTSYRGAHIHGLLNQGDIAPRDRAVKDSSGGR